MKLQNKNSDIYRKVGGMKMDVIKENFLKKINDVYLNAVCEMHNQTKEDGFGGLYIYNRKIEIEYLLKHDDDLLESVKEWIINGNTLIADIVSKFNNFDNSLEKIVIETEYESLIDEETREIAENRLNYIQNGLGDVKGQ